MRKLLIILFSLPLLTSYAEWRLTTKEKVKNAPRIIKAQKELDGTSNKSMHDLSNKKLNLGNSFGRNFSFCDFNKTDISGIVFERCNFSFARNLDKAITDEKTKFIESNFTGCPRGELPNESMLKNCNTNKTLEDFTDDEMKELFK